MQRIDDEPKKENEYRSVPIIKRNRWKIERTDNNWKGSFFENKKKVGERKGKSVEQILNYCIYIVFNSRRQGIAQSIQKMEMNQIEWKGKENLKWIKSEWIPI